MAQAQGIDTVQSVTNSYESLHRLLELAIKAEAQRDPVSCRQYCNSAAAVLESLDSSLEAVCSLPMARTLHQVYRYMIRQITRSVLIGREEAWRVTICEELAFSLARAWKEAAPHA